MKVLLLLLSRRGAVVDVVSRLLLVYAWWRDVRRSHSWLRYWTEDATARCNAIVANDELAVNERCKYTDG